ncbi:MAG: FHA domain-containing protein, partial [Pseudomonadales bacterium]|nr:FHA domain-containing protein [Pseudomonadales bacterium]
LDLNSTNGTFVNFRKTRHHLLKNNDLIVVGEYRLKFVEGRGQKVKPAEAAESMDMASTVVLPDKIKKPGFKPSHLRRIK